MSYKINKDGVVVLYNEDGTLAGFTDQATLKYIKKRMKEVKYKLTEKQLTQQLEEERALTDRLRGRIKELTNDDAKSPTLVPQETEFAGGAKRKVIREASHLICPELMRRTGLIFTEGIEHYRDKSVNYAEISTARFGLPLDNLLRHLDNHYLRYRSGDTSEDNLAKIAWAIQQIMHQESPGCQHYNMLVKPEDRVAKPNTLYVG